jgi:hypothetical protein
MSEFARGLSESEVPRFRAMAREQGWTRIVVRRVRDAPGGRLHYTLWGHSPKANPKRRMTKAQKRVNASKRSKQRRIAKALRTFLKAQNPASKYAGAKIRRNKGSITIIPIKLRRGTR